MKTRFAAYLFWLFGGVFGLHKFYLGRPFMGLFYMFTGGGFGIGWLLDAFTMGRQVDMANAIEHAYAPHPYIAQSFMSNPRVVVRHRARPEDLSGLSPEKQILRVAEDENVLTVAQVVARTNLELDEAEEALTRLADRGIAHLYVDQDGKAKYDFS
jgi:TM2 domain-containing membrane protein YozV